MENDEAGALLGCAMLAGLWLLYVGAVVAVVVGVAVLVWKVILG